MNKTEFIVRQLKRAQNKKYEGYVISRIWHLLDRADIKFVTQQYVSRPEGFALTDLFLPQLRMHIEVDEPQHFDKDNLYKENDSIREADIINATNHKVRRINANGKSIEDINNQVQSLIEEIQQTIISEKITPWDYELEQDPETFIKKGKVAVKDDVAFKKISDACNCFGHNYKGCQKAFVKHPIEKKMLWFPKLYENKDWYNSISPDEKEIYELQINNPDYLKKAIADPRNKLERIVFARVRSNLGDVMYRFKGVYKLNLEKSIEQSRAVYLKVSDECKTYKKLEGPD